MKPAVTVCWFRRDLRLHDQAALSLALRQTDPVLPLFIFDRHILDRLEDKADRRVEFIYQALEAMQAQLAEKGSTLVTRYGYPLEELKALSDEYDIRAIITNHDYEPYARERDEQVAGWCRSQGIRFETCKDTVIFEKSEVVKDDGKPYTVFTPYSRRWKASLTPASFAAHDTSADRYFRQPPRPLIRPEEMGFSRSGQPFPPAGWQKELIRQYREKRDFPGLPGTSRLSVHLRFGTVSIRQLARETAALSETFLNELIWRDFYHMILWHFPQVATRSFKPDYDKIRWRNNEQEFAAWCAGQTGYPIVDAGMRELNATGFMHNRVRMIVASFLTKHLLIDWRWGEAYFAAKLLDYDLAANNGGWQWAAGSGCDAAPYFRVFNPYLQTQKFDPQLTYIKKWVPEFQELTYPRPIVEHDVARKRCLEVYSAALKG